MKEDGDLNHFDHEGSKFDVVTDAVNYLIDRWTTKVLLWLESRWEIPGVL